MSNILVIHGPNLNMLGIREQHVYGVETLSSINQRLEAHASEQDFNIQCFQSNSEAALIEAIQAAHDSADVIIINPAGLTYTSVCLRDALLAAGKPFIEVHISNIYAREPFRSHSYLSDVAVGTISGLGTIGYDFALQAAITYLKQTVETKETWQ